MNIGTQPRFASPLDSTIRYTSPAATLSRPSTSNQKASRRRPNASTNTPTTTRTAPITSAVVARASPLGLSPKDGVNSSAETRTAPIATASTKEKRDNRHASTPTAAVVTPTAKVQPLKSSNGRVTESLGQTSTRVRKPMATAGKTATARAAARPPGTNQPQRSKSHEVAANPARNARAVRRIQSPSSLSGTASIRS